MNRLEYINMYQQETSYWWYRTLHQLVKEYVLKNTKNRSDKIFDAGCGTGRILEILNEFGNSSGIDYSEEAISFARQRGLRNIEHGDLNTYSFEPNSLDVIISLDVLYHKGIQDDLKVVGKFHEALKPGGILILNLPAFESLRRSHDVVVHTRKRYHKSEFVNELNQLGFSIEKASYRLPYIYAVIRLEKILARKKNKNKGSDLQTLPSWLNGLLYAIGTIENKTLIAGLNLPVGSSLFIVAKKQS